MRWPHFLAPQIRLLDLCSADVAMRAALPQNRVEMQVDLQAEFEMTYEIRIHFLSDYIIKLFRNKLIFTQK